MYHGHWQRQIFIEIIRQLEEKTLGGIGSGNRNQWSNTSTTEDHKRIDVGFLRKRGILNGYSSGTLTWSSNGQQTGLINYTCTLSHLILDFRYRWRGEDWQPVTQHIPLAESPCNYGGTRKWLTCPRCQRRCGALYSGGPLFLCRTCYRLPYASQTKGPIDRMILRKHKLEDRIFDESGYRKRKGMHWRTFERLLEAHDELDSRIDLQIYKHFSQHLEGIPRGGYSR